MIVGIDKVARRERLRNGYLAGKSISNLIRDELRVEMRYPQDLMFDFIDAFAVSLADVSCIDFWWPDGTKDLSDTRLDEAVRRGIEAKRAEWKDG